MSFDLNEKQKVRFDEMAGEGEMITLRGKEVLILPVLFKDLSKVAEMLTDIGEGVTPQDLNLEKVITFVYFALKQAYPEITEEEVGEILTIKGFFEIYKAVMAVNDIAQLVDSIKNLQMSSQAGRPIGQK